MNIDPLAEKNRRFSTYTYCVNNPVFFIDPDGMMHVDPSSDINAEYVEDASDFVSPIYGSQGQFLGTDSEGFKGKLIFMKESTFLMAGGQGMSHNLALNLGETLDQVIGVNPKIDFTQSEINMVNNAITDVVSRTDGNKFSSFGNQLHNGRTSSSYYEQGNPNNGNPTVWRQSNDGKNLGGAFPAVAQTDKFNGLALITYNLQEFKGNNFTVGNLQNTWDHEFGGHFKGGIPGGSNEAHAKALFNQSRHSTWQGTTLGFRTNIRNVFLEYTGRKLNR